MISKYTRIYPIMKILCQIQKEQTIKPIEKYSYKNLIFWNKKVVWLTIFQGFRFKESNIQSKVRLYFSKLTAMNNFTCCKSKYKRSKNNVPIYISMRHK